MTHSTVSRNSAGQRGGGMATGCNRSKPLAGILNTTLASNGGPTRTHALVAGSPALDIVTDGTCPPPATDQRGVIRPRDSNADGALICDIGAFEG
jgi:hypothetical protein